MSGLAERLWDLIAPYVEAEHVELDDLEVLGTRRAPIVRVTVDADGGVDVDHIAELSRGISRLLDEADPTEGPYTLEVSSPGLERKLRLPRHYEKSIGREVKVKTTQPIDGERTHQGRLTAVDDRGFVLDVEGTERRIDFDHVHSARTVFVWDSSAKPGTRR